MTKTLKELINLEEPAWPMVQEWLKKAKNPYEIIPSSKEFSEKVLLKLQVTTKSPMGAIAYETGGIVFDHGWLRILGAGSKETIGNLLSWNGLDNSKEHKYLKGALVIAHDVVGGFFAINGDAFEGKSGNLFYFSPDTYMWEEFHLGYSEFIYWAATGDMEAFYSNFRWGNWKEDVAKLDLGQGFSIYPPMWAKEGGSIEERSKHIVPMQELWNLAISQDSFK